jgi:hypothetical protein
MNDQSPPPAPKKSVTLPWVAWILAATLMPALPFLLLGKNSIDQGGGILLVLLAMVSQLACSIWLAIVLGARGAKSGTFVALVAVLLVVASIAVGTASFFAACITLGPALNFH